MKSKRGEHKAVLVAVIAVGIIGLYFSFAVSLGPSAPSYNFMTLSEPQSGSIAGMSGKFAAPAAKGYGGDIKGIVDGESRAFSGRATEMEKQNCYACSCHDVGLTASSKQAAETACKENCGGTIISESPGACR